MLHLVQLCDICAGEDLLRRADAVDPVARHAHHGIGDALCQLQLVERQQHRQIVLPHHALEHRQQLQLIADVQKAGGLVQHDDLRLLTQRPRQEDPLALPIADVGKGPVGKVQPAYLRQGALHNGPVLRCEDSQFACVGIAAGTHHVPAGHQLRLHAGGHQNGHAPGNLIAAVRLHGLSIQKHRAGHLGELADDGFQYGGFSRAVGAYQRDDPAPLHMEGDVLDQRLAVVAHGQVFCFQICHTHAAFLWIIM